MSYVKFEKQGAVAVLTISRPEVLNALNAEVVQNIGQAVAQAAADPEVRVLVLTGDGPKSFVAGADIGELQALQDSAEAVALCSAGNAIMSSLETLSKPVIAAVNGFAFGGGLELALCADIRIASAKAKLGLPELGLGIIPGYGGTQRLTRLIGPSKAKLMLFTGNPVSADEALRIGLVDEVVAPEEVLARALALAQSMAEKSPAAVAVTKKLVATAATTNLQDGLALETHAFAVISQTAEAKAGLQAFLSRKK